MLDFHVCKFINDNYPKKFIWEESLEVKKNTIMINWILYLIAQRRGRPHGVFKSHTHKRVAAPKFRVLDYAERNG